MGVWKDLSDYPTNEDIIYEIVSYLIKDKRNPTEFSLSTLNSVFDKDWEGKKTGQRFNAMVNDGMFEKIDRNTSNSQWFKIRKEDIPYIEI